MKAVNKPHRKALAFVKWLFNDDRLKAAQFFDVSITEARAWWERSKFVPFFQALATAWDIKVDLDDFTRLWSPHSKSALEVLGKGLAKDWLINELVKQGSGKNRVLSLFKEDPLYQSVLMLLYVTGYDLEQWLKGKEFLKLLASIYEACTTPYC